MLGGCSALGRRLHRALQMGIEISGQTPQLRVEIAGTSGSGVTL